MADEAAVRKFVADAGLGDATVEVTGFEVTDALAQIYRSGPVESAIRDGRDPGGALDRRRRGGGLAQRVGELVSAGVVLSSEGGSAGGPVYLFTGLNAAKPEMVAEATRNARASAEQFANDSGSASAAFAAPARACSRSWPATRRRG